MLIRIIFETFINTFFLSSVFRLIYIIPYACKSRRVTGVTTAPGFSGTLRQRGYEYLANICILLRFHFFIFLFIACINNIFIISRETQYLRYFEDGQLDHFSAFLRRAIMGRLWIMQWEFRFPYWTKWRVLFCRISILQFEMMCQKLYKLKPTDSGRSSVRKSIGKSEEVMSWRLQFYYLTFATPYLNPWNPPIGVSRWRPEGSSSYSIVRCQLGWNRKNVS